MLETFYIHSNGEDNYQLRLVDSHMTIATASTEETILTRLEVIVKRYKNKATFTAALMDMDERRMPVSTLERREQEYLDSGEYSDLVKKVVVASLKTVKEENTPKLIGRNTIKILPTKRSEPRTEIVPKKRVKKKIGLITL